MLANVSRKELPVTRNWTERSGLVASSARSVRETETKITARFRHSHLCGSMPITIHGMNHGPTQVTSFPSYLRWEHGCFLYRANLFHGWSCLIMQLCLFSVPCCFRAGPPSQSYRPAWTPRSQMHRSRRPPSATCKSSFRKQRARYSPFSRSCP